MELIEREAALHLLQAKFRDMCAGEGHSVFVSGEAGIGKTSLLKVFCSSLEKGCPIYRGSCDALFTPRPLSPLYDILLQLGNNAWQKSSGISERTLLFSHFLHELQQQDQPVVIIIEDIHWADEATLDFIKFLARRINQLPCLFMLTYRDNEIDTHHPLRNLLGQLAPDSFTRLELTPLSKEVVEKMALERGYNGQNVYKISGGNPFYVNEILASYSTGVPDNIRDSILSVFNRQQPIIKQLWEILSVLPTGLETALLGKIDPQYPAATEQSLAAKILLIKEGLITFKHELYRRTIETSLSPLTRLALNKKILDLFLAAFEQQQQPERIIHHAKNANEYELVVQYAPVAAQQAAAVGAHIEASRLYLSAIEYYQGNDKDVLIHFYEAYAYECYLTNRTKEAIIYTGKSLQLWQEKNDTEKTGNCLRFLSRLWWFEGNRKNAENYGQQAVSLLENQASSAVKAMAFSNMSQLKMLSGETADCIAWGEKAIAIASELNNEEILAHALNNVGTVQLKYPATAQKGMQLLQQSLDIALRKGYHEHVARAYTNLGSDTVVTKDYAFALTTLDEGIRYCEERDLDSWTYYMLSWKARLLLETGHWQQAYSIADNLMKNESQPPVVRISALAVVATIGMRRGSELVLPILQESKTRSFEAMELQRIVPAMAALLEYEWINETICIDPADINNTIQLINQSDNFFEKNVFAFWLRKTRKQVLPLAQVYEAYSIHDITSAQRAAKHWKQLGCPYEQALALSEGNEEDKKNALLMVQALGATPVYERMKLEMRASGIKSIPRGIRKNTRLNSALLTAREVDVLQLLKEGLQNKEIASRLFISAKTVDHHISSILFKLDVNSRTKAVQEAARLQIIK